MSLYGGIKFGTGPVVNAEAGPSRQSAGMSTQEASPAPSAKGTDSSSKSNMISATKELTPQLL